ncbi:protein TBATA-like isoform X2 [Ptychodera flava]|uniref:protein TBATA-like isoform X2 n=1 Tax=Ptychodera flava TaxID=63121 RepID=UPI00396A457B
MPVETFIPSTNEPLLVRGTMGHIPEHNTRTALLPTTRKDFAGSRPATMASARFGQLSQSAFFARHNPHPARVRHIKGLLDVPICAVHDEGFISNPRYNLRPNTQESKRLYSYAGRMPVHAISYNVHNLNPMMNTNKYPLDIITGLANYPWGFKEKASKYGMVPVTDSWKDELRSLTEKAGLGLPTDIKKHEESQPKRTSVYSADTGRLLPPPSRAMSRGASRQQQRKLDLYHHIAAQQDNEALVLEMLCQILQTDSVPAVQAWLVSAGQREKDLVLDMIQSALVNEQDYYQRDNNPEFKDIPERPRTQPADYLREPQEKRSELPQLNGATNGHERKLHTDLTALRPTESKADIFRVNHSPRPPTRNIKSRQSPIGLNAEPRLRYTTTPIADQDIAAQRQSLRSALVEEGKTEWRPEDSQVNN